MKYLSLGILMIGYASLFSQDKINSSIGYRYGRGGRMVTITSGAEFNNGFIAKGFYNYAKKDRDPDGVNYYGSELGYRFTKNNPIDIITTIQVGVYDKNLGVGFPRIETRWNLDIPVKPSLILSPDHIEVRVNIFKIFD